MDEYLECLYSYLMENKFVELNDRTEYITLKNMRDHAEKALMGTCRRNSGLYSTAIWSGRARCIPWSSSICFPKPSRWVSAFPIHRRRRECP